MKNKIKKLGNILILKLAEKIEKEYKPEKIILYGSYAWGNPTQDSDIDLFIVKNTKERPIDRRVYVRRIIRGIDRPMPFSSLVVIPEELNQRLAIEDQFIKDVLEKGKVLYG